MNQPSPSSPPSPAVSADTGPWAPRDRWWVAGVAPALGLLFIWFFYLLRDHDPVRYAMAVNEDAAAEYGTAMSLLAASAALAWLAWRGVGWRFRLMTALSAFVLFAGGMEEISWGQRLLGLETPEPLREVNIQNEITVHNLVTGETLRFALVTVITLWLAGSAWLSWTPRRLAFARRWGLPLAHWTTAGLFIVIAVELASVMPRKMIEGTECLLGLAVMAWAIERALRLGARKPVPMPRAAAVFAVALLLVAASTAVLTVKRPIWYGITLNNLADGEYLANGDFERALAIYHYIEANPRNRREDTSLNHAATLAAMGRHDEAQALLREALPYYQGLVDDEPTPQHLRLLGRCYLRLGMTDQANELFRRSNARPGSTE